MKNYFYLQQMLFQFHIEKVAMELIINTDNIQDNSKREWLFRTLKLMGIDYTAKEAPQTSEEYNSDLQERNDEIEMAFTSQPRI